MPRGRRRGRPVDGILLLDKPQGDTSNRALQRVKRLYGAAKAGHTGSLDPLATGLLPICFGEATKLSTWLLDADKRYLVEGCWGARTDSGDAEGEVVERSDVPLDAGRLSAVLAEFTGEIMQVPPMHSAVKHQGRRLYELARQGIEVERAPRAIRIHAISLVRVDPDQGRFVLDVRCSKGTYVRTLVEDIAAAAGGLAHVSALRRTGIGPYDEDRMVPMARVEQAAAEGQSALDALLLPIETVFGNWPKVVVDAGRAFYLSRGQSVRVAGAPEQGEVAVFDAGGRVLGVGCIDEDGMVAPRRWLVRAAAPARS